jgi:hypothetical protein
LKTVFKVTGINAERLDILLIKLFLLPMAILQNKPSEEFGIDLVKDLFANEIHEVS